MIDWLEGFYRDPDLRSTLLESFVPVFETYAQANGGAPPEFVKALAEGYVDRHLGSSRAQLQELVKDAPDPLKALTERFAEWEDKRPGKVANSETVRASNAIALQQMTASGVKEKVWRTVGTCAFCLEMKGRTTTVEKDFVKPGDALHPEGVEVAMTIQQPIGHPPLHQGCRCFIEPVGFQQNLGLFPEPELPLMTSEQRYRYINASLRPEDPQLAEAWERTVDVHRTLRDDFIDRDSFWTGEVRATAPDAWGDTAEWDGSISLDLKREMERSASERFHVLLHESLHHYSADALNQEAFLGFRGWEEGLVEQLTRIYRKELAQKLGMTLDQDVLKTWEKTTGYNRYISQLEKIRKGLGQAPRSFYEALHAVPTNQRIELVRDVARSHLEAGDWSRAKFDDFMETVRKAHLELQV